MLLQTCRTWSVPKGHMEQGETEEETALREVFEEVGIKVESLDDFCEEVHYTIGNLIEKRVALFAAETGAEPQISPSEIQEYRWATAEEAKALLYSGYGAVLDKLEGKMS